MVLEARRAVEIEWLDLAFRGWVRATSESSRTTRDTVRLGARLAAARRIDAGTTRFDCRLSVPDGAPPSFRGMRAACEYVVDVHASIAWWPDAKQSFVVNVGAPAVARGAPRPVLVSSSKGGNEPYVELSLSEDAVEAGGVLDGSIAFGNVRDARFVGCDVTLVAFERVQSGVEHELLRCAIHVPVEEAREGEARPFAMRLPAHVPAAFELDFVRVRWVVEVRAKRRMARDLVFHVPVTVLSASGDRRRRVAPPDVGQERVARLWASVGAPLGFAFADGALAKSVGEARLAIRRDFSRGPRLLAEVRFPPLGIALSGGALRGVRRLVGDKGIALGNAAWDARHQVSGRFEHQVKAFGAVMLPALAGQRVAELADDRIVLEAEGAGLVPGPLATLARAADGVARALPAARAAVPPPPGFDVGAWRTLAERLDGRLEPGPMRITGMLEGHGVEIETDWAGAVAHATRIALRPRVAVAERWHGGAALPEAGEAVARRLPNVEIGEALVFHAPVEAPAQLLERLVDLAELAEILASGRHPYR